MIYAPQVNVKIGLFDRIRTKGKARFAVNKCLLKADQNNYILGCEGKPSDCDGKCKICEETKNMMVLLP